MDVCELTRFGNMKPLITLLGLLAFSIAGADEAAIRAAVARSLPLLERSSVIAIDERSNCFTFHHTGLPVMTFVTARERGFKIDAGNLQTQLQFTTDFLAKGRANYLQGKGQGGQDGLHLLTSTRTIAASAPPTPVVPSLAAVCTKGKQAISEYVSVR